MAVSISIAWGLILNNDQSLDDELQEMLDHHRIRKTLSEYCHGCDRCDEAVMSSVYTEDSWDDHGIYQAPGAEFSARMIAAIHETTSSLFHLLGQSLITVTGDEAVAETYFFAASTSDGEDEGEICNQLGGRFVDKLRRENGRWLIRHRTVVRDWAISLPVEADWTVDAGLKRGMRSADDCGALALTMARAPADSG